MFVSFLGFAFRDVGALGWGWNLGRVQSSQFHLNSDVKQVVVALAPESKTGESIQCVSPNGATLFKGVFTGST